MYYNVNIWMCDVSMFCIYVMNVWFVSICMYAMFLFYVYCYTQKNIAYLLGRSTSTALYFYFIKLNKYNL